MMSKKELRVEHALCDRQARWGYEIPFKGHLRRKGCPVCAKLSKGLKKTGPRGFNRPEIANDKGGYPGVGDNGFRMSKSQD